MRFGGKYGAFLSILVGASLSAAGPEPDGFMADFSALCSAPHRLAGTDECEAAAQYVARRLRESGIEQVLLQPFTVMQSEGRGLLRVDGVEIPLYPMRANLWQLPVSGPEPIRGRTLVAGDGSPEAYGDQDAGGRVVVFEYETARRWRDAFAMGAKAVIFVETPGKTPGSFERYETISADMPRFYVTAEDAAACGLLDGGKYVEIEASGSWSQREGHNVLAWIPGTDPVFSLQREEAIVLSAQLDSFGEVPGLSRGARGAANCAALLEAAGRLARDPPRRSVLIAFLDGETRCLSGSAALYTAIFRSSPFGRYRRTNEDFIREHEAEQEFIAEVIDVIDADDVFAGRGAARVQSLHLLRAQAESVAHEIQGRLMEARMERLHVEQGEIEGDAAALDDVVADLEAAETDWNELRRSLARGEMLPGTERTLNAARRSSIATLEARRTELDDFIRFRRASAEIGNILSGRTIILHLSFDFGCGGPRWGIAHRDNSAHLGGAEYNQAGYYVGVFGGLSSLVEELRDAGRGLGLIEPETVRVQLGPSPYFRAETLHAGQMASRFGVYGLRLATCHDPMLLVGHPQDRPGRVDAGRIRAFAEDAFPFIKAAASATSLSVRQRIRPTATWNEPEWTGRDTRGYSVMTRTPGSAVANRPAAGAMLARSKDAALPGFDLATRHVVDQNGCYSVGPTPEWTDEGAWDQNLWCSVLLDEYGRIASVNNRESSSHRVEMFPCRQYTVTAPAEPDFAGARTLVLSAAGDGAFQAREFFMMERGRVATFFVPPSAEAVKLVNNFGVMLLNADDLHPEGRGFELGDRWTPIPSGRHTAEDLLAINESRLDLLRARRITNDSLEWMHGLAGSAMRRAGEARSTAAAHAENWIAARLSRGVYGRILGSINDLVKAVVILLLLTIPFAHAMERLLIGTPHIYRRIGWYAFFFLLTFFVLYNVHPAFAIATEPIIIFLAFFIIILSSIVITMLLNRFQSEIKKLQGLRTTVHSADVSRLGALMAAVAMGISTMRRRPIRTILTAVTVILLTFSILSFASFDAQAGILRRYVGTAEETRWIFVHHALWSPLPDRLSDVARHISGNPESVAERRWVAASTASEAETFRLLAASIDGTAVAPLRALVGLDPADIEAQPGLGACFRFSDAVPAFSEDSVFLPPSAVEALGVEPGETLLVNGRPLTLGGVLMADRLSRYLQISRTPVFPVDRADPLGLATEQEESAFLPYYSAEQVGFIHSNTARDLGGRLVAVSIYPDEDTEIRGLAERIARISSAPVYATFTDGVYRMMFTTVLAATGLRNLVIPIILGGLIVFGTMLGSVTDREREIYSFSSLGLAPSHIGMLFFAEASVYAVVGGLGGYILGQAVAFASGWISRFAAIQIPEMNYSSTNAIFAMLVVMATVLISTVYPAFRGARSANPGVARAWRLPPPKGDLWEFTFPFTVSDYDITGIVNFLYEHFNNFSDCSLGAFISEGASIFRDGKTLNLRSKLATAPFDLGVTEDFVLTSVPSEIEGVDEVRVVIRRLSGTRGDWQRTNRPFISDLRKQFLIWRSLTGETMESYRRKTLSMLGEGQAES